LVLRKDPSSDRARARGAAVVAMGALTAAVALVVATPPHVGLVTWPVAGLLVVVATLAVPAATNSLRRARLGVSLEATREGVQAWPLPTGPVHHLRAAPRRAALAEVVEVSVHTAAHPPLVLFTLEVHLADGTRLLGPELATSEGAGSPLSPAADALRDILRA
jgi:hypothetical protein